MSIRGSHKILVRTSVIDSIVTDIKDKIISGELNDGDMLASQDDLAKAMGVSRASLREALNRLSLMGLIEMRHGTGTFVKTTRPLDFMNSLSSLLILDHASARELLDARFHIESAIAGLAAANATDEDIEEIGLLLNRAERELVACDADGFATQDLRFHMMIAECSRNRVLIKVIGIVSDILSQFILNTILAYPMVAATAADFHRQIYEAIKAHDSATARQRMEEHMRFLIDLIDKSEKLREGQGQVAGEVSGQADASRRAESGEQHNGEVAGE